VSVANDSNQEITQLSAFGISLDNASAMDLNHRPLGPEPVEKIT
jgi:hypothetical protein